MLFCIGRIAGSCALNDHRDLHLLLFYSCIFSDLLLQALSHFLCPMVRTNQLPSLDGVDHDQVTSGLTNHIPSVTLQQPDQLATFHVKVIILLLMARAKYNANGSSRYYFSRLNTRSIVCIGKNSLPLLGKRMNPKRS